MNSRVVSIYNWKYDLHTSPPFGLVCTLGPDQVPKTCVSGFWSTNCRFEVPSISWTMSFLMFSKILQYYIWWFCKEGCNTMIFGKILSENLFFSSYPSLLHMDGFIWGWVSAGKMVF